MVDEAAAKVKAASGAPKRVALQKEQPRARAPVRKRNAATKSLQKVMPAMEDAQLPASKVSGFKGTIVTLT